MQADRNVVRACRCRHEVGKTGNNSGAICVGLASKRRKYRRKKRVASCVKRCPVFADLWRHGVFLDSSSFNDAPTQICLAQAHRCIRVDNFASTAFAGEFNPLVRRAVKLHPFICLEFCVASSGVYRRIPRVSLCFMSVESRSSDD